MKKYTWAVIFALWNTIAFGQEIFLPNVIKKTAPPVKINTDCYQQPPKQGITQYFGVTPK